MQRIVVLNPKGGSGKTTIAINLASYYAQRGERPALIDYDPQASAARWVRKRQASQAPIYLINAFERDNSVTRAFQLRVPDGTRRIIIDTPAAVEGPEMPALVGNADKILVPVLPSDIDIHACARCITSLLLVAKVKRAENRLAIIANRVRRNTRMYQSLTRFLGTLDIPIVATLRDSQNFVRAAELGLGLHEMKHYQVSEDLQSWTSLLAWLDEPSGRAAIAAAANTAAGGAVGTATAGAVAPVVKPALFA